MTRNPLRTAALVLAAPLAAQSSASLWTDTTMVVHANGVTRQWLSNTRLDPYGGILAAATIGAMARTNIQWSSAPDGTVTYQHIEDMQVSDEVSGSASVGSHRTRMHLTTSVQIAGRLIVDWQPGINRGNGSITVQVDVDSNGSADFTGTMSGPAQREFFVVLGTSGRTIRTTTQGALGANRFGFTQGTLTITWDPLPPCGFSELGAGCGPTLTALNSIDGNVDVILDGGPPGPAGRAALFLGFNGLVFQIPGTNCFLHTEIPIVANLVLDAAGRATLRVPILVRPVTFNMQAATLDFVTPAIQTTNAIRASCN
jgi:hypothetical protein